MGRLIEVGGYEADIEHVQRMLAVMFAVGDTIGSLAIQNPAYRSVFTNMKGILEDVRSLSPREFTRSTGTSLAGLVEVYDSTPHIEQLQRGRGYSDERPFLVSRNSRTYVSRFERHAHADEATSREWFIEGSGSRARSQNRAIRSHGAHILLNHLGVFRGPNRDAFMLAVAFATPSRSEMEGGTEEDAELADQVERAIGTIGDNEIGRMEIAAISYATDTNLVAGEVEDGLLDFIDTYVDPRVLQRYASSAPE